MCYGEECKRYVTFKAETWRFQDTSGAGGPRPLLVRRAVLVPSFAV